MIKLAVINIIFIMLCMLVLVPIIYTVSVSLNANNGLVSSRLQFFPSQITFEHYRAILNDKPFLVWIKNSLLLSVLTVAFSLLIAVPASYSFSRYRFRGRNFLLSALMVLNAFPAILTMFAIYRVMKTAGLLNSDIGLVIIYTGSMVIFAMWNMKGYFDSLPVELEEAARIDGVSEIGLITRIIMPLARPSIVITAVLVLIFVWNEYIFATVFLTGAEKYTLALGLYSLQATEYTRNWPLFSAGAVLTSLPVLVLFFALQKYMVSGLTTGGVKN